MSGPQRSRYEHKGRLLTMAKIAEMEGMAQVTLRLKLRKNRFLIVSECAMIPKGQATTDSTCEGPMSRSTKKLEDRDDYQRRNLIESLMKQGFIGNALVDQIIKRKSI